MTLNDMLYSISPRQLFSGYFRLLSTQSRVDYLFLQGIIACSISTRKNCVWAKSLILTA